MSDGMLWLLAIFGLVCVLTVGRVVLALVTPGPVWRPFLWVWAAFGFALYVEFTSPVGATFDAVMRGFIFVAAKVI